MIKDKKQGFSERNTRIFLYNKNMMKVSSGRCTSREIL